MLPSNIVFSSDGAKFIILDRKIFFSPLEGAASRSIRNSVLTDCGQTRMRKEKKAFRASLEEGVCLRYIPFCITWMLLVRVS